MEEETAYIWKHRKIPRNNAKYKVFGGFSHGTISREKLFFCSGCHADCIVNRIDKA